jgi:hypothetical protein
MGTTFSDNFSKSIDYKKDLHIIFDIYPAVNYGNSTNNNNNLLEKNIRFRQYIKQKIKRSIHKISNIQFNIPENKFIIKCDVDLSDFKIYYKIYITIEFTTPEQCPDLKVITYKLLEKTITDRFTRDINNKTNIKIDKTNFIYLDVGAIRNLKLH